MQLKTQLSTTKLIFNIPSFGGAWGGTYMKKTFISLILGLFICTSVSAQFLIKAERMADIKANINNIENGTSAYKALIEKADNELKEIIVPVTEKKDAPPSGDKHDYISMGPYWWADPSSPDGLPYIRKDGQRNPEVHNYDRYKMDKMMRGVITLGYAYYFTKDEKYAVKAMDYLNVWFLNKKTRMNPNLNYGQIIPGHNNGKGRAEGIIDIYILVEMVDCVTLLSSSKAMRKKDLQGIKTWFSELLDWMLTSEIGLAEYRAKNNHGMAYDVQVVSYALFTGRNDIVERFIGEFAQNRLFKQIEPDGSQPLELARTKAMHYSIDNIGHTMDMCFLAQHLGINLYNSTSEDGRSIAKAIEFIKQYLGKPQSEFPYQQINEWDENQNRLCWLIKKSTFLSPNEEYDLLFKKYCKTKNTDIRWLLWN
jgi:Alginate lyase.